MESEIEMLKLGFNDREKEIYERNKISINKGFSRIQSIARKKAKLTKCYICGKECSSFCKSHSVPQFCLKRIAIDGKVFFSGIQQDFPILGEDSGVNDAGTFSLICRECDNTLFQDYENPNAYDSMPSGKALAQIAMKDYLQIISKRLYEKQLYTLAMELSPINKPFLEDQLRAIQLDLDEYIPAYNRAKIASSGGHDDWYYAFYYKKVDYVVPYAAQSALVLFGDFEDNIINDVYNYSPNYHTKDIHIAIFPLAKCSAIIGFVDSQITRYRSFYKQLRKLQPDDQLSAINYIIHSYAENVFLSKAISKDVLQSKCFKDVCQKSSIASSVNPNKNPISSLISEFSLSKRSSFPNLLSEDYALPSLDLDIKP